MNSRQTGFTLIELVMVIVILGVLAVVALPKFVDFKGDAEQAAVNGVAGSLSSGAAINYAARKAGKTTGTTVVDNCNDGGALLQGGLPAGYAIAASAVADGNSLDCTLTGVNSTTATFTIIGTN